MFTDYKVLAARLSEIEKIQLRAANNDRLEWLFHTSYKHEINLDEKSAFEMLKKVKEHVNAQFLEKSNSIGFN